MSMPRNDSSSLSGDLEHQAYVYTEKDAEYDRLLPAGTPSIECHDPLPSTPPRIDTKYLGGLRGLFSIFVYMHHFTAAFTLTTELGFGWKGNYHFTTLPFIRVPWSNGGPVGVAVFFILSGYVLSVGTLRKLKSGKLKDARRGILSGLIRRPIRLYLPALTVTFFIALLLQVPGLMLADHFSVPQANLGAQLRDWFWSSFHYFSIFRDHVPGGYYYDGPLWTLPVELKGSLLVYSVLSVLTLGMSGADNKVPHMMAVFIFACSAIMLQMKWKWSMAESLFGIVLAILDVWPPESGRTSKSSGNSNLAHRVHPLSEASRLLQKVLKAASLGTQKPIRQAFLLVARVIPRSALERLSPAPQQEKPILSGRSQSTIVPNIVFVVGWYLISMPSEPNRREVALETPGFRTLARMIPPNYLDFEFFRYWQAWGAFLMVWALLRLPWLQRCFMIRPLQYFGSISFLLYLTHMPYIRILPGRLIALFGGHVSETIEGSFWDHTLAFPDVGPVGLSSRFLLCLSITLPINMVIAKYANSIVDRPGANIGRYITEYIGLDHPKSKKQEGLSLPK